MPEDERIATEVVAIGRRLGLPVVAVQPVYCLAPSDAPKLRLLAAIRANALLDNPIDFAVDEVGAGGRGIGRSERRIE